jgi:hypothetical protein
MRSVADQLRDETRRDVLRLEPLARIELALRLGDEDAKRLALSRGIPEADSRRELARQRQAGRQASPSKQR